MKKYIALFLTLALLLALTACGGTAPQADAPEAGKDSTAQVSGDDTQAAQDIPFGSYHTEAELLAMLESGDFSQYLSVDPALPDEAVDTGGDEPYGGFSNSVIFTDGGDGEGVEYPDFISQLSPEQQEEWREMEKAMTDPEMIDMLEGME